MPGIVGRATGFICGMFLVIIGFSLLTPEAGVTQTPQTGALISVLTALGIGVIAASLLPNSMTVGGEKVQPLGLSLNATGGAAFFVVTLVFLFYMHDKSQGALTAAPAPSPTASVQASASPNVPSPSPALQSDTALPADIAYEGLPAPAATPMANNYSAAQPMAAPPPAAIYHVRTYCSYCCPYGPQNCLQVGEGHAPTAEQAALLAANMCVTNGGVPASCLANLEEY